ncbi:MAG TPA: hypothetical protein VJN21_05015 [Candidatus Acidoferrales bacterium]|nr:hypothetical protein [Candidatus Acidoferrales bacterium]
MGNVLYRGTLGGEKGIFWGPDSLVPRWKDFQDFYGHVKWFLWLGPKPRFDRFAYWEKVDCWAVFWGMAVIGFSGYTMWFAPFFAKFLPGSWLNVALLLHGEEALLAVWFIFAIHFFNTHLRPGSFPMDVVIFTGSETEEEFKSKHPAEYERLLMEGKLQSYRADAPPPWLKKISRVIGTAAILVGFVLLWLTLSTYVRE